MGARSGSAFCKLCRPHLLTQGPVNGRTACPITCCAPSASTPALLPTCSACRVMGAAQPCACMCVSLPPSAHICPLLSILIPLIDVCMSCLAQPQGRLGSGCALRSRSHRARPTRSQMGMPWLLRWCPERWQPAPPHSMARLPAGLLPCQEPRLRAAQRDLTQAAQATARHKPRPWSARPLGCHLCSRLPIWVVHRTWCRLPHSCTHTPPCTVTWS